MKRILLSTCLVLAALLFSGGCGKTQDQSKSGNKRLEGTAEDLWGNRIDLSTYDRGLTLVEPFSPSFCGYCLLVGEFVEINYFRVNHLRGGHNFEQCLFSPQKDIYAFQKYYRDTSTVLTWPVSLHRYHEDGYPALLAFQDGEQILNGNLDNYGVTFKQRASVWWSGQDVPQPLLPSGMKMAETWQYETKGSTVVFIVPDRDTSLFREMSDAYRGKAEYPVRYESDVTSEDLKGNLEFVGKSPAFRFASFTGQDLPFAFDDTSFQLGTYSFPRLSTGIRAIAPNPYRRDRYVSLKLSPSEGGRGGYAGWADFRIWQWDAAGNRSQVLLDGRFAKDEQNHWRFADSLAVAYANLKSFCKGGVCPVPGYLLRPAVRHLYTAANAVWTTGAGGRSLTVGNDACRFPSLATSPDGAVAVVWEERGDILMAIIDRSGTAVTRQVEDGAADAYNPLVVWDGDSFLILYLSNADNYYHLYGRYLDNGSFSPEFRMTGPASFDVLTPAVASANGTVALAWSDWCANTRFPKYRLIRQRTLGPILDILVVPDGAGIKYTNAWGISLAMSKTGEPYGMWNQHYPAAMCACGGPLKGPVTTPQRLTGSAETSEVGEYPSTALDSEESQWAVWCTSGPATYGGESQRVLVARYDSAAGGWSLPFTVSRDSQTFLAQTPSMAIGPDNSIWVAYSGRPKDERQPWGIYLTHTVEGKWQAPIRISEEGTSGRAPSLVLDAIGRPWVTWHAGVGNSMRVRVWTVE
jgi:hypothetical protein